MLIILSIYTVHNDLISALLSIMFRDDDENRCNLGEHWGHKFQNAVFVHYVNYFCNCFCCFLYLCCLILTDFSAKPVNHLKPEVHLSFNHATIQTVSQSVNQKVIPTVNQPFIQTVSQSVNQWNSQSISPSTIQTVSQSIYQSFCNSSICQTLKLTVSQSVTCNQ